MPARAPSQQLPQHQRNGGTDDVVTTGAIPELGGGIVEIARGYDHTLVLKGE